MERKGICIGELIHFGWRAMKKNFWFFFGFLILSVLIPNIFNGIASAFQGPADADAEQASIPLVSHLFYLIGYILSLVIAMGWVKVGLNLSGGQKTSFKYLFSCFPLIIKYFVANLLYSLLLVAGLILLVFPMFIWGVRYALFPYFIVDKGLGPIKALKMSAKTTMGAKWDLFGLYFVCGMIQLAGLVCLFVGLFAALPTIVVAQALAYRKLLAQTTLPKGM